MSDCGCAPDVPEGVKPDTILNDPDVINPVPDNEPFLLPLCVTREQYQAIVDSLNFAQGLLSDNGCYNERTAVELLLSFLPYADKPLEIPCVNACDIISECIDTNPGTIEALTNYMTNLVTTNSSFLQILAQQITQVNQAGEPISEDSFSDPVEGDLLPDEISAECDYDKLFGAAGGIVDYFNDAITDVFEALEQASNTIEYSAIAAQLAPAIGSTASSAIEFADQVQETLAEAYAGEYTVEVRDQLACDIFCRAIANDCHITLETINAVLLERLTTIDFDDFAEFVLYFTTGAFEGTQVVEVAYMLVVQALRYGSQFAGILGLSPIAVIAKRAASTDPDSSWSDLCGCAGDVWQEDIPAETGFDAFTINEFAGNTAIIVDNHIEAVIDVPNTNNMFSDFQIALTGDVTKIRVFFETDVDIDATYEYRLYIDGSLVETTTFEDDGSYLVVWEGSVTGSHTYQFLTGARGDPADGNFLWTTSIIFNGTGANPFP